VVGKWLEAADVCLYVVLSWKKEFDFQCLFDVCSPIYLMFVHQKGYQKTNMGNFHCDQTAP